jgi:hypothetical protein
VMMAETIVTWARVAAGVPGVRKNRLIQTHYVFIIITSVVNKYSYREQHSSNRVRTTNIMLRVYGAVNKNRIWAPG